MNSRNFSGVLTGPTLLSSIEDISLADHDDLTHCTQIATQSADTACSRFVDSTKWLNEYMTTLSFLGWSVFQDAIFTRTRHDVLRNVADFLVESAGKMPDSRQGNAMIDTLDALKPDKPALLSLDQESLLGRHFQVIPARYDAKGFLEIAVFNLELVASTNESNFLYVESEKRSATIIQQRAYLKLDKRILETKRTLIDKKRREIRMKRFDLLKNNL
jgi:hypothetical protein